MRQAEVRRGLSLVVALGFGILGGCGAGHATKAASENSAHTPTCPPSIPTTPGSLYACDVDTLPAGPSSESCEAAQMAAVKRALERRHRRSGRFALDVPCVEGAAPTPSSEAERRSGKECLSLLAKVLEKQATDPSASRSQRRQARRALGQLRAQLREPAAGEFNSGCSSITIPVTQTTP